MIATKGIVREMIGRVAMKVVNLFASVASTDVTQSDYAFWDALRRGKKATYKLAGLFAQPIVHHIVSWTLGKGVMVRCAHEATETALNAFVDANLGTVIEWVKEGKSLGDSYLVVNPDGTVTQVPPHQVEKVTDDLDYRAVLAYRITTNLDKAKIVDEFRLDGRAITVTKPASVTLKTATTLLEDSTLVKEGEYRADYQNLIGRLPVTHYANYRASNELYGHPEYEALLELFGEYDDVATKALQGVKLMGNPIPVMEHLTDPAETRTELATGDDTYTDVEGVTHTEPVVDFDSLDMIFTKGTFDFKSPRPFTEDAWRMLKGLFYLMLQHSHVPEWVWGGAIASSKASVDAQMPAWELFIELQRLVLNPLLIELLTIWLAFRALVDPSLDASAAISLQWPSLSGENEEIKLKKIERAKDDGLLSKVTELQLLDLVENAEQEVDAAGREAEAAQDNFEQRAQKTIDDLSRKTEPDEDHEPDEDKAAA